MVVAAFSYSGRQELVESCEFQASMVYIANSRPALAT